MEAGELRKDDKDGCCNSRKLWISWEKINWKEHAKRERERLSVEEKSYFTHACDSRQCVLLEREFTW